jgi:hypothetical protein
MADTLESILGLTETTTTVMPESVVEEENNTLEDILGIKPIIPAAEPASPQVAPSINTLEDILNLTPEVATRKVVPQGPQSSLFIDLDKHFAEKYNNKPLIKEDIISDPDLIEVMTSAMEARFKPAGLLKKGYKAATATAGGTIGGLDRDYRSMSPEDLFETYQNYQRSLAGLQTVTVANESVYGINADDITRAKLGAGYRLFNQMDNAFTGEGSWAEAADATGDYLRAGLHDPSTLFGIGFGRLLSVGTTKATGLALRTLAQTTYRKLLKAQLAKGAALPAAKQAARVSLGRRAAATAVIAPAIVDGGITMGADVAYQMQLIRTDAQETYSRYQTGFAALGSMVLPSLVLTKEGIKTLRAKGKLTPDFARYIDLDLTLGKLDPKKAMAHVKAKLSPSMGGIFTAVDANFGTIRGSTRPVDFKVWDDAKQDASGTLSQLGGKMGDNELTTQFFRRFFFGDDSQNLKGYAQVLEEAGFQVHPSMREDGKISGIYGQTISWLDDDVVKRITTQYENTIGRPIGLGKTSKELSKQFIQIQSGSGAALNVSSILGQISGGKLTAAEKLSAMAGKYHKGGDKPKRMQFGLSVYKRLLTSHLSTTGANLKGFKQLVTLNNLSDFATSAINFSQSGAFKLIGNTTKAEKYYNRGWGSFAGAIRRGYSVVSPDIEMAYARKYFNLDPKTREALFRDVAGDGGAFDSIKQFNLDPNNKIYKGVDGYTKAMQTLSLARVQDDITKTWTFGNNMNQAIMREYGITPEQFFKGEWKSGQVSKEAVHLAMGEKRFLTDVAEKALFRTQRETASVNWSRLETDIGFGFRTIAEGVETLTNKSPVGFIVPFGSFLNTTLATAADLTGVNAMRMAMMRATGKEIDFVTREGSEILGKTIVGYSTIGLATYGLSDTDTDMLPHEQKNTAAYRVKNGLAYNQQVLNDGSIADVRYDWPNSTIQLTAQILAHATMGEFDNLTSLNFDKVPADLLTELGLQLGGQAIRDMENVTEQSIYVFAESVLREAQDKDYIGVVDAVIGPFVARAGQGLTRHVEPVNEFYKLFTDQSGAPDLNMVPYEYQGYIKYIDGLVGGVTPFGSEETYSDLPKKLDTFGKPKPTSVGKQIMFRQSGEPISAEMMMNAAGMPSWKATKFDGPAIVKRKMQSLVNPYFEVAAIKYLNKYPDFFEMEQKKKAQIVADMQKEVQGNVKALFEDGHMPQSLTMLRDLSKPSNKKKALEAMKFLGITGSLEDVYKREDALSKLNLINVLIQKDNYRSIIQGFGLD